MAPKGGRAQRERRQIDRLADFLVEQMRYDRGVREMLDGIDSIEQALAATAHLVTAEDAAAVTGVDVREVRTAQGQAKDSDRGPYPNQVDRLDNQAGALRSALGTERDTTTRKTPPAPNIDPLGRDQPITGQAVAEAKSGLTPATSTTPAGAAGSQSTQDANWIQLAPGLFGDPRDGSVFMYDNVTGQYQWIDTDPNAAWVERVAPFIGGFDESYSPTLSDREAARRIDRGQVDDAVARRLAGADATGRAQSQTGPLYREFDKWRMFSGLSPEQTARVNQALMQSGMLPDDFTNADVWTRDSAQAMEILMLEANAAGRTWVEQAEFLAANQPTEEERLGAQRRANPFIAPTYRAPDPATLRQAARQAIAAELGRDPEDWEMALLTKPMSADFRAAYQADVSALRSQHDAGNHALATDAESGGGGTVGDVDPMARMQERLLELYANEIEAEKAEDERQVNTALVSRGLAGLEGLVG